MRRREFMMLTAAGLVAASVPGSAQSTGPPRVAFLSIAFGLEEPVFEVFNDELRALGQIEGKTFRFELHVAPITAACPPWRKQWFDRSRRFLSPSVPPQSMRFSGSPKRSQSSP